MKVGKTLVELASEIQRQHEAKVDYVAPTAKTTAQSLIVEGESKGIALVIPTPQADVHLDVNSVAHRQLGGYLNIPAPYYDRMLEQEPELLARNINTWLAKADDKRMIRTLDNRPIGGAQVARAYLSDKFRALDNYDLAEAILPILGELGVEVISSEITEHRLYIKVVDQRVNRDIPTGHRMGDGTHTIFDTCCPVMTIGNSEVGSGSLYFNAGVFTKGCTNLATFKEHSMRKYHVGKRQGLESDDFAALLSDQTKRLTDAATWSQAKDVVRGAFDEARFNARCDEIAGLAAQSIKSDNFAEVVKVAGEKLGVTKDEQKSVLAHLIKGGDLTRYGLFNAITRTAEDIGDYDRATDFERLGGEVIALPANEWKRIAEAA